jgi:hypothetical protein
MPPSCDHRVPAKVRWVELPKAVVIVSGTQRDEMRWVSNEVGSAWVWVWVWAWVWAWAWVWVWVWV